MQIVLITPAFFYLAYVLRKPGFDRACLFKWGAIGLIGFTFALWIKHFLLNLYALPINFSDPVLFFGFLNSTLTLLTAGLILFFAFLPIIRVRRQDFNPKVVGFAFLLIGAYFSGYLVAALLNQSYFNYLFLTELWGVAFLVLGAGYMLKNKPSN